MKTNKLLNTVFAWLLAWPVIGVYADGWHHHHLDADGEALLNPFHQFFYAGAVCAGLFLVYIAYKNKKSGKTLYQSLPKMYMTSFWGIVIFLCASALDLSWHKIFGFEQSVDALLSPPHLLLAFGGLLTGSALIRPIWNKEPDKTVSPIVPVLGFTYYYLVFIFFLQYAHPYYERFMAEGTPVIGGVSYIQAAALSGAMVRTVLFCAMLFTTLKSFRFPKGSLLMLLLAEGIGIAFMGGQYQYIASAAVAGLLAEIIYHTMYGQLHDPKHLRIFGFLIASMFYIPYIFTSLVYDPTWWSIHMIAGMVVMNGIAGYLLTYLVRPPELQAS